MNNIQQVLFETIEKITDSKLRTLKFDKTIEAIVVSDEKADVGEYQLKFQDLLFPAFSSSNTVKYKKDDNVLVLVPDGDMSNKKTIVSTSKKQGETYVDFEQVVDRVGVNLVDESSDFRISLPTTRDETINFKIKKQLMIEMYPQKKYLAIGAELTTNINNEDIEGEYGIAIDCEFITNSGERHPHTFKFSTQNVTGNPFRSRGYKETYIPLLADTLVEVIGARAYSQGFTKGNEEIEFKNIVIEYVSIRDTDTSEYSGNIVYPKGLSFRTDSGVQDSKLPLVMQFKQKGQVIDTKAIEYLWFVLDANVVSGHPDYHPGAGEGWRMLRRGAQSTDLIDGIGTKALEISSDFVPTFSTFKCIGMYLEKNVQVTSEPVTIMDYTDEVKCEILSSNGVSFVNGSGSTHLMAVLKIGSEPVVDSSIEYEWLKMTDNGTPQIIQKGPSHSVEVLASSIGSKSIIICQAMNKDKGTAICSASITLVNVIDGTAFGALVVGGFRTVLYGADGKAPTNLIKDGFQFDLYDNGDKVLTGIDWKWSIPPVDKTLLTMEGSIIDENGNQTSKAKVLNLGVAPTFDANKYNNVITLDIDYTKNGLVHRIKEYVNISITKVGQNGADGSAGKDGADGHTYVYEIQGGMPVVTYGSNGILQNPQVTPEFILMFSKDGDINFAKEVDRVLWRLPSYSKSSISFEGQETSVRQITTMKSTGGTLVNNHKFKLKLDNYWDAAKIENYITAEITYGGMIFREVYPISVIKNGSQGEQGIPGVDGVPGTPGADGQTLYTWIRYADTVLGGGISDSPTGKSFIGLAYNKTTAIESNNPSDYSWSLIKGSDGRPGADGSSYYTWIRYSPNQDGSNMTNTPQSNTKYIGIAVNKASSTPSSVPSDYTWSLFRGENGTPGADGFSYTINILGGTRGIAYAADGTNPNPSVSTPFTVEVFKNSTKITPASISWTSGGNVSGTSTTNTFTPLIKSDFASGNSFVTVSVRETSSSEQITQTVPIVSTKFADGLDWLADWNSGVTTIKDKSIASPRIFAGVNEGSNLSPVLTGVALGKDVLSGSNTTIGIVGYKRNNPIFKIDAEGNFLVSPKGSATDVINGTGNGLYFNGTEMYITGKVKIKSGSTIGSSNTDIDDVVSGASQGAEAINKVDNLKLGGRNLLLNSRINKTTGDFLIQELSTSIVIEKDRKYTLVIDATVAASQRVTVYLNGTGSNVASFPRGQNGVAYMVITGVEITNAGAERKIRFYNSPSGTSAANPATIRWASLFEGEIKPPTDWVAAPEDLEKVVVETQNTADNALTVAGSASSVANSVNGKVEDFTLEVEGNTRLKGELIVDGSITGEAIKAGSFTIRNREEGRDTFTVNSNGDVTINGILRSDDFDVSKNLGYKITPDGTAIFNQAVIRGELELPEAGITNYGAQIGNENLAKDSEKIIISPSTTNKYNYITAAENLREDQTITLSVESTETNTEQLAYNVYLYNKTDSSGVEMLSLPISKEKQVITFTKKVPSISGKNYSVLIYCGAAGSTENKDLTLNKVKVEYGTKNTPWCPAKNEQGDYVRFWAGSSRAEREGANFRVTQKGDLWATNATLSGRMIGNYDNGLIHIHDNQIVINNSNTFVDNTVPGGALLSVEPFDYSPQAHVVLSKSWSILNNSIIFGSETNRRLEFLNNEDRLKLNMAKINIQNSSKGSLNLSEAQSNKIYLLNMKGMYGGAHAIGYNDVNAGLLFESMGSSEASNEKDFDFKFARGRGKAVVKVQGDLIVDETLSSPKHDIEMRCVANEGWGFFAN